ncbi:MAG: DUF4123 domain-containing protein [Gemmataceae bacterium]
MELMLVIKTGDDIGKRIVVPMSVPFRVGRSADADFRYSADPLMSALHFAIELTESQCKVRDLGSRFGTSVNGVKITESNLSDGDEISVGRTAFAVSLIGGPSRPSTGDTSLAMTPLASTAPVPPAPSSQTEPSNLTAIQKALVDYFRSVKGTLYGLLDAAREPTIVSRMERAKHEFQCLYDGEKGDEFSAFGPWLVHLPKSTEFLSELVRDGWGKSWGLFIVCDHPFAEIRRHLRKFLLAKLPDGREVFFRFYDPRVLRTYLPTCTAEEVREFVGPLDRILVESTNGVEVLEFAGNFRDWKKTNVIQVME